LSYPITDNPTIVNTRNCCFNARAIWTLDSDFFPDTNRLVTLEFKNQGKISTP